mmetsp:Transcript_43544/g.136590  ORF Transcript_43544/g.136590 Transcript_43544/m.136590 type:complete len:607 (+) Transcript_43544:2-1822(+)
MGMSKSSCELLAVEEHAPRRLAGVAWRDELLALRLGEDGDVEVVVGRRALVLLEVRQRRREQPVALGDPVLRLRDLGLALRGLGHPGEQLLRLATHAEVHVAEADGVVEEEVGVEARVHVREDALPEHAVRVLVALAEAALALVVRGQVAAHDGEGGVVVAEGEGDAALVRRRVHAEVGALLHVVAQALQRREGAALHVLRAREDHERDVSVKAEALVRGADLVVERAELLGPAKVLLDRLPQLLEAHALLEADDVHVVAARQPRAQRPDLVEVRLTKVEGDGVDARLLVEDGFALEAAAAAREQRALGLRETFVALVRRRVAVLVEEELDLQPQRRVLLEEAAVDEGVEEALEGHEEHVQVQDDEVGRVEELQRAVNAAEEPRQHERADEELQLRLQLLLRLAVARRVLGRVGDADEHEAVVGPGQEQDEVEAVEALGVVIGADPAPEVGEGVVVQTEEHDGNDAAAADGQGHVVVHVPRELLRRFLQHEPVVEGVGHAAVPDDARERPPLDHEALVVAEGVRGVAELSHEPVRRRQHVDHAQDEHEVHRAHAVRVRIEVAVVAAEPSLLLQQIVRHGGGRDDGDGAGHRRLRLERVSLLLRRHP